MSSNLSNIKAVQKLFKPKKKKNKKTHKIGLPPGALVFTGDKKLENVEINLITYDEVDFYEETIHLEQLEGHLKLKKKVIWIDIIGLHDVELMEKIGLLFGIHKLTLEDILNVDQRPKMEVFDNYLFAAMKMIQCATPESPIDDEQISFILKDGILLTFQEKKGDVFEFVRSRLTDPKRAIRQRKTDYLLYALLDAVIDNYFIVMENVGERIENLESQAMTAPGSETLNALYGQRREMMDLRRTVYPLREVIGSFDKYADDKISAETRPFIRDLYENTIQVIETMEVFRDMSSGVLDLYMNSLSNRMNNIMKVLTIISTIFIPLSFVAGVYGMNFDNMPELHWKYGYFYVLGGMGLVIIGMLYFFKRKNWI
ncbi:magnesium/cobalt transporter CorA [Algoriphagus sp. AGSA1]|uniref:magnesium/cobalt transporter CorA n=1 Tax=Algoriphagus sp. AGSA1 TaxID=2907213 RepID=UPI001F3BA33E|nr:magnesium/cobalt transporter CorA [Algoriphagus sp. AGSA1]MCE7056319.1 magnesium/cobalt transporter CorA [Algoriphagus sp. AGSA1]